MRTQRKLSYTDARDDDRERYMRKLSKHARVVLGKGKPSRNRKWVRVGKCHPDWL